MPMKDRLSKKLFTSESLSELREKLFSNHKFFADTFTSDKKYKHLG